MGLAYADIELVNGEDLVLMRRGTIRETDVRRMHVRALVDSGAYMLGINEEIEAQLMLPVLRRAAARLTDDSVVDLDVVGPLEVRFENRSASVDAIVLPGSSQALLGSIPMEYMDVVVEPRQQRLIVNPEHPYVAGTSLV